MTKVTTVSTFRRPVLVTTKKSGDGPGLCRMGMLPIGMLRVTRLRRRCRSTPTWGLWNMIPMGAVRQRARKWESSMRKVKRRGERMRSTSGCRRWSGSSLSLLGPCSLPRRWHPVECPRFGINCWGTRRQGPQQRGDLQPASCWRV